ncbi:MAG: DUF3169 family protein [Clostridia bacterium]
MKKKLLKTLGISLIGALVGFSIGAGGKFISNIIDEPIPLDWFTISFSYLMVVILVVVVCIAIYSSVIRGKIKADGYNDSEDSVFGKTERLIGLLQSIATTLTAFTIPLLLGFMLYTGIRIWVLAVFLAITIINFCNEVTLLNLNGKINPKQNVDWSKFTFNRDIYEKMDEYEKKQMGQIGATLVSNIHIIFAIVMMAVLVLTSVLDFSGYELILVGVLWGMFSLMIGVQKWKVSK